MRGVGRTGARIPRIGFDRTIPCAAAHDRHECRTAHRPHTNAADPPAASPAVPSPESGADIGLVHVAHPLDATDLGAELGYLVNRGDHVVRNFGRCRHLDRDCVGVHRAMMPPDRAAGIAVG